MNGFTKKRVGTLTLGEKLKLFRSEKRMSLTEISRATKIQMGYLESLEEGEYDKLPVDVYVKGFIRSYAEFLGISEAPLIRLYEKERGIKRNLEKNRNPENGKKKELVNVSSFVFTPQKITAILVVVLAFLGFFYLYKEIGSFASAPRLAILSPAPNSQTDSNSVAIEGITEKDSKLFINGQPVFVPEDGKFRENITLQSGVNVINVKSINRFEKEADESVTIQSNFKDESNQGGNDSQDRDRMDASNSEEIQIELRVDPGPVWISVESDDNLVFSGTMLSGTTQTFKAKDKISINSGKANATYVKFNGKDIGTLSGDPGAIRGVVFNKDTKY